MAVVHKSSWGQFVVVFTGRPIAAYVTISRPRPIGPILFAPHHPPSRTMPAQLRAGSLMHARAPCQGSA